MLIHYLSTGESERTREHLERLLLEGESAISMALDSVLEVVGDRDPALQSRVEWGLKFIRWIALRTSKAGLQISTRGRDDIGFKLGRLLREYHQTQVKLKNLAETYDFLNLWGRNELWFIGPRAATLNGLIEYYTPLISMVPELSEQELLFLEKHIRAISPRQLVPYMALYQIGRATERDYVMLFRLYAAKFGEAFQDFAIGKGHWEAAYYTPAAFKDFEDSRRMVFYNETLRHLRLSLLGNDPLVTAAFETAMQSAERSEAQDGLRQFRTLFFRFLQSGAEDLMKKETIQALAENSLRNGEYVLPEPPRRQVPSVASPRFVVPAELSDKVVSLADVRARKMCRLAHRKDK